MTAKPVSYIEDAVDYLRGVAQSDRERRRNVIPDFFEKCTSDIEALAAENVAQKAQFAEAQRIIANMREHHFVNVYPDKNLPIRILESYVDDSEYAGEPGEIVDIMNKARIERNAILRRAIDTLSLDSTHHD